MRPVVPVLFLVAFLVSPSGAAQWIDDPEGDHDPSLAGVAADAGRADMADILAVDVSESEQAITFTVAHGPRPDPELIVLENAYYLMQFMNGEQEYRVSVYYGVPLASEGYYRADLYDGAFGYLGRLDAESTDDGFLVHVEKDRIPDHTGLTPRNGAAITDFFMTAENQRDLSICMQGDCIRPGASGFDQAPNGDQRARYDFVFGLEQDGDIRLDSPAPVRWSNGEATVFVYELVVTNNGDTSDTIRFQTSDIPAGWQVLDLDPIGLDAGARVTVPYPVKVPFAHAHGTDPRFVVEAIGMNGVGRVELGVHYPAIPQPTGHHSILHIHSRDDPVDLLQQLFFTSVGVGTGADAYMNTASSDEFDDDVPVQGSKTGLARYAPDDEFPGDVGSLYEWVVPLSPSLRVGLAVDEESTEGVVDLGFDVAAGEVRLHGRLAVLDEEDQAEFAQSTISPDTELGQTIATIEGEEAKPIASKVTMPFTVYPEPGYIDYAPDQQLFLFLRADVYRPEAPLTPNLGVYLNGGEFVVPLREYHDSVPVNVTFEEDVIEEAILELDNVPTAEETQESPTLASAFVLIALTAMAWVRRRA